MKNKILFSVVFLFILLACEQVNEATNSNKLMHKSATDAHAGFSNLPGIILDVRTPEEFEEGHPTGAILANIYDETTFNKILEQLPTDTTIYVICKAGGRSKTASNLLIQKGVRQVINIKDGFDGWKKNGLPFE